MNNLAEIRRKFAFKKRRIIMNNDGNDLVVNNESEKLNPQTFINRRFTGLENTQVDAISYCTGIFDSYTHNSSVSNKRYVDGRGRELLTEYLFKKGTDSLQEAIKFCKKNDLDIFWSFRFNDTHDSQNGMELVPWKAAHRSSLMGNPGDTFALSGSPWAALNYSKKDVRDQVFAIIEDVISRYDVDGIEIDFYRHLYIFPEVLKGYVSENENRQKLTSLISDIRESLNINSIKKQKPLLFLIRIPDSIPYCYDLGIDIEEWLKMKFIDIIIAGGYFKLEPWTYIVDVGKKYDVPVYACLTPRRIDNGGSPGQKSDLLKWRGEAYNALKSGVNGIYTFNRFNPKDPIFKQIGDYDILEKSDRIDQESFVCDTCWFKPQRWLKNGDKYLRYSQK